MAESAENSISELLSTSRERVNRLRRADDSLSTGRDDLPPTSQAIGSSVHDGGYGWAVVFGCSVITFWSIGMTYSWGIIQTALIERMLSPPSTLAFVGTLTCTFISVFALVNARIIHLVGTKNTALIGVFFLGLGQILSGSVTQNIGGLFVTEGVIMGVGTSLCFLVVSIAPAQYFDKKRGLANGIVYAGGGLGGTVLSLLMERVLERIGPVWTFRTFGLATLGTGLPAALLIKERSRIGPTAFIEWGLLQDFRFIFLFLAGAVGTFSLFVPSYFLPLYSRSLGFSSTIGSEFSAGFSASSAAGRLMCGIAADVIGPLNTLFITLFLSAASLFAIWPVSSSLGPLTAFVVINGAANGGFFATMPTVVRTVFGSERLSVAMAMIVTGWGGGYLMGAPIAGYLLEAYGGEDSTLNAYHPAMFYAGSMALGASGMVALARLYISRSLFKKL